ncbi:hypothetical protein DPMN_018288 [Dreissena polymorpha]|uniref:Uncharacterized protein n=1 Tax=Dreissena polymorpha TaxID=45954 RepID=A0A9D4NGV8_DREPO|nr:hypothetical protein DPMN_018288 [Dreissena polymorpha]
MLLVLIPMFFMELVLSHTMYEDHDTGVDTDVLHGAVLCHTLSDDHGTGVDTNVIDGAVCCLIPSLMTMILAGMPMHFMELVLSRTLSDNHDTGGDTDVLHGDCADHDTGGDTDALNGAGSVSYLI